MSYSLGVAADDLREGWKRLCQRWHETTEIWGDRVRWQFQDDFWNPLEAQLPATRAELERLADCVTKAHRSVR